LTPNSNRLFVMLTTSSFWPIVAFVF
jgi:hypothetical protein